MIKLGILGIGKMGGSILNGVVDNHVYDKDEIAIYTASSEKRDQYRALGFNVVKDERDLFNIAPIIVLAVKPQMYSTIFEKLIGLDFEKKAIISLAPGKSIEYLETIFNGALIVRAMPNTPALIGEAITTIAYNKESKLLEHIKTIFISIGQFTIAKEEMIDNAIPLNGSMPAYVLTFAKYFIENAKKYGIEEKDARELCLNAIVGSAKLALSSNDSIDTLIDNVCSKGGSTIEGLNKLRENSIEKAINECYDACVKRSKELSK